MIEYTQVKIEQLIIDVESLIEENDRLRDLTYELEQNVLAAQDQNHYYKLMLDKQREIDNLRDLLSYEYAYTEELTRIHNIMKEALIRLSKSGDGSHRDKHASFYDCLPTLQIEFDERLNLAKETLERIG